MKTKHLLYGQLGIMAALLGLAIVFPAWVTHVMNQPSLYLDAKFVHVLAATLFFANTVIGTLWEWQSLRSKNATIIRHTYGTVSTLDAVFTSPLILLTLLSGLLMATVLGGVGAAGWLSGGFALFILSGLVWVTLDIPMQGRLKREFRAAEGAEAIPPTLMRLLHRRMLVNLMGMLPLLGALYLMVHKPTLPPVSNWLPLTRAAAPETIPPPQTRK